MKIDFERIPELVSKNAAKYPNKTFIFFKNEKITYKMAEQEVLRTAHTLRQLGVKQGDRVSIMLGNSPEYIYAYFGIVTLGAIAVPQNTFLKGREVAIHLNDCGAGYFITSSAFAHVVEYLNENVSSLKAILSYEDTPFKSINIKNEKADYTPITIESDKEDIASIIYTSGTTGLPKGVMLTHKNLLSNIAGFKYKLATKHKYKFIALLPLFHSYAYMATVLGPMESGCSIILLESIVEASKKEFKKMLMIRRPDLLLGVPQLYSAMAKKKLSWIARLLYPIKIHVSGGAPLPAETLERFNEVYGRPVIEGYGLSEASPIVSFNPLDGVKKPGTVGTVLCPEVEVKVVDENGNALPVGEAGELCVRGDNVMKGYWNQPEETAKALRDGWLHTGDIATIDSEGYITIVDRLKDLIITKGINVYPREIEELLYQYKGISLAAVIGIPDKDGDEIITAYIKANEGVTLTESEIKKYLKDNLAAYKVPKTIIITDNIPTTPTGKVMKRELRTMAAENKF